MASMRLFGIALLFCRLLLCSVAQVPYNNDLLGGEKAAFHQTPFVDDTYENFTNHRTYLCDRYELVRTGEIDLKLALSGLELTSILIADHFFLYSDETGINSEYPGLAAHLMDLIAERAGFTWRNSFDYSRNFAEEHNMTWTEFLWWGANMYDIGASWFDHSLARMEMGISYVEPWYDASIILIDKLGKKELETWDVSILWNWTRPFDPSVWVFILFTILVSALVYQLIEHLNGENLDRPMGQWFLDNFYLSLLNFTTNFEYAPSTSSGRIFAVSMAMWALILSATYTANLANLFVDDNRLRLAVTSMEEAVAKKVPICTYWGTNSDALIKKWYKNAVRRPQKSEQEMFKALYSGECGLAATSVSGWKGFQGQRTYNPDCNMQRVGDIVDEIRSGFAIKADVGYKCTSLIRDVFNLYFQELIDEGELENAWETHNSRIRDIDCEAEALDEAARSRNLRHTPTDWDKGAYRRRLKSSGAKPATTPATHTSGDETSLTLDQMMGTFVLHYGMMLLALILSCVSPLWAKWTRSKGWEQPEPIFVRSHGPIVGTPPTVDAMSHRSTAIQAYRSHIGTSRRIGINTYVLPKKGPLLNTIQDSSDEFEDELNDSSLGRNGPGAKPRKAHDNREEAVVSTTALSRLRHHFNEELKRTSERYEERLGQYEKRLDQNMGTMVEMLYMHQQEIRTLLLKDQRQDNSHTHQYGVNLPANETAPDGASNGKRDFGRYLRGPHPLQHRSDLPTNEMGADGASNGKRNFGRYLRRPGQLD